MEPDVPIYCADCGSTRENHDCPDHVPHEDPEVLETEWNEHFAACRDCREQRPCEVGDMLWDIVTS